MKVEVQPGRSRHRKLYIWSGFALFILAVTPALACEGNPICTVKDPTGTPLNIRAAPRGRVIGTAKNGTKLSFIDHQDANGKRWARVTNYDPNAEILDQDAGMVFARFLKCDGELKDATPETPLSCVVADPTGTPLNIRLRPNGEILGSVRNGQKVRAVQLEIVNGKPWVMVWRDPGENAIGWVFDDYLTCEEDSH